MNSVNVSVEVPLENAVHEISYEGVEVLKPPLSMSENLTNLAQRIDFSSLFDDDPERKNKETGGTTTEPNECTFSTVPTWPWESIRGKLRSALTEVSVLGDVMQIIAQKRYMVLDPVQAEGPDHRPGTVVIYKKRGLSAAASVLLNGAERIRSALHEPKSRASPSSLPDFHIELLRLRQNWRLRKMGNVILGDLSYKTVGSRFPQAGVFEVRKAELENDSTESGSSEFTGAIKPTTSALRVTVPTELQGIAYIQVIIQYEQNILSLANIGLLGSTPAPTDTRWQQRLEAAQNVLFCRELFAVLAREAVQVTCTPVPPQVVGNQITTTLFPGTQLIIGLCHGTVGKSPGLMPKLDHNHVLEHSLHQLLRDIHRQNCVIPMPHPSSGQLGISKKRRLAGPLAYEKGAIIDMSKKNGILEEIIRQARHVVLRLRTMSVLDELANEIKDPLLVAHWASFNAVTHSCVRINLMSAGYDMTARTPLVIHVEEKSLKCILKDGKAIYLSYEPQELRDTILSQVAIHQIMALQSLSKCMGWSVLSSSIHLGVGNCERLGNAAGCYLSSPNGKRALAVRSAPQNDKDKSDIQIFVYVPQDEDKRYSQFNNAAGNSPEAASNYSSRGMVCKTVNLDQLEGKNFVNKMEMLMAVLSDVGT